MHDQRSFGTADDEDRIDHTILVLLLEDDSPHPWSVADLAREVGDATDTDDSLARLAGAGLVHRSADSVFASRAALRSWQLVAA